LSRKINSRAKGKRGELEARDVVRKIFRCSKAVRSAQVSGTLSSDISGGPHGLHLEVKRYKGIAACRFWDQARGDAEEQGQGAVPVVIMREDRGPWLIMFAVDDVQSFVEAYQTSIGGKQ